MKKEIYTVTDQNNQIWEVKVFGFDDANVEVRCKGTNTWQDANWGIFTKNHGIDHDSLA